MRMPAFSALRHFSSLHSVRPLRQPRRPLRRTPGRRPSVLLAVVALALASAGCQRLPVNLQVSISPGAGADQLSRQSLNRLSSQMAREFMQNNPGVNLHLRYIPEAQLLDILSARSSLGVGPDLMITRAAPAQALAQKGLSRPSELTPAQLAPLAIKYLAGFRQGHRYLALPFLVQPSLACYDRRRIDAPPQRLGDLVRLASEGKRIGLPLLFNELLWTATGFGAEDPLIRLLDGARASNGKPGLEPADRKAALAWLQWLYRANVEPTLKFLDNGDQLVQALEAGKLDWISCNATAIRRLRRDLGANLAVSPLPRTKDGEPSRAFARLLLISFGRDSNPEERRVAQKFALFVLNDYSQNNLMERAVGNMPVNQTVIVPVKNAPELAAMEQSLASSIVPDFRSGVGVTRLAQPISQLLKQTIYGDLRPAEALQQIEALAGASQPEGQGR